MRLAALPLLAATWLHAATPPARVPVIANFKASPSQLILGQTTTLTWTVTGATGIKVDPGAIAVTGSSLKVTPQANTTYTLTATNLTGSSTATASVTVAAAPPTIVAFTASPTQIAQGQKSVLSWTVTGATTVSIDSGIGVVTGNSLIVGPKSTTKYTLTATNAGGSRTATATVMVGAPPAIANFTAIPNKLTPGQSTTLSWTVAGASSLRIDPAPGAVTGSSIKVTPTITTTYVLTATNAYGQATASTTVFAGSLPSISSFTATPQQLSVGQSSTLRWVTTGATSLSIDHGVGPVSGTSAAVSPTTTTTYTLTATNVIGSVTATVTVVAGSPPTIASFGPLPNAAAGPGISVKLLWSVTGATSLSIDHGVGNVLGTSITVGPTATTTYTLTATNGAGSVKATATVVYMPLIKVTSQLYYSEHVLFLVPNPGQVNWVSNDSWDSVYSTANVNSYVATLKSLFQDDFFFVVVAANNLTPNNVPSVLTYRHLADGIGMQAVTGVGVPNICRYNIGGGTVIDGAFGVLDHEIGHNWELFIGAEVGWPHWLANSTATGQMADIYSDDGYITDKIISGDPIGGFTWTAVSNIVHNQTETFSLQDLYLQGFNDTFPPVYVLTSPVYNPDHTVSYASVAKYDQAWLEQKNGLRYPTFHTSDKRLRMGVIYVARDVNEILTVYQPIERSMNHFTNAEQIDNTTYQFQVPFLVDTQYRASVNALLADLDGNHTPNLYLASGDVVSANGSASMPFLATDPDGAPPTVSCVPASANCSISGQNVVLTGLASGVHFFTVKAQDSGGKKTFAHFVVEVQ